MKRRGRKPSSIRGFLLDEDVSAAAVDAAIEAGFKAGQPGYDPLNLAVPAKGTPDPILLQWASKRRFCFVTKDQGLASAGRAPSSHWGIVVLLCDKYHDSDLVKELARGARRPDIASALRNWRFAFDGEYLATLKVDGAVERVFDLA